ncbi:hypothetical protein ACFLXJ_07165 [Chloroflexota bacterium]
MQWEIVAVILLAIGIYTSAKEVREKRTACKHGNKQIRPEKNPVAKTLKKRGR